MATTYALHLALLALSTPAALTPALPLQATPPPAVTSPEAPDAAPPADAAPPTEMAPAPETAPPAESASPDDAVPAQAPAKPVEPAPEPSAPVADEPAEPAPVAVAPVAEASEGKVEAGPQVAPDAAPKEQPINPRPEGEEELMSDHPVANSKSVFVPGDGLKVSSDDGKFSMAIRLRVQIRDEISITQDESVDAGGEPMSDTVVDNTFGIRRARLQFKGNVFGKNNKYKVELAVSPKDLGFQEGEYGFTPLLSWYTEFTQLRDISLRLGQYKLYYSRQRVISSGDQEFVDRSAAQSEFNLDRDIGFHFFSKDFLGLDRFRYYTGISLGEGRDVWGGEELTDTDTSGYQYLARVEALPFGEFEDYSEVDFSRENRVRLSIGGAYAFLKNGTKVRGYQGDAFADGGTVDYHNVTADMMLKWAGLTAFTEFYFRSGERGAPVAAGDTDNLAHNGIGGSVQAGYLLPAIPVGVGARYSTTGLGGFTDQNSALSPESEIGGTAGWYLAGHELKLQGDFFHLWGDDFNQGAEDRVRIQLQVAY